MVPFEQSENRQAFTVDDGSLTKPLLPRIFRLALLLCSLVTWGLVLPGSQALAASSGASAWGDNTYGQLGDGYEGWGYDSKVPVPVPVSGLSGVRSVAAGGSYGLALMEDGTVMTWGNTGAGQLGDGAITQTDVPVAVKGLSGVTAIAAGESHSLALLSNGTVMAWGYNNYGQLGNGGTTGPEICESEIPCSRTPIVVKGLSGVEAIAAGSNYSLALLSDGTVMSWGEDTWGQLGDGSTKGSETCAEALPCSTTPVAVSGLSEVTAIAAGGDSLALLRNGTVMDWGYNGAGQLGNGSTTGPQTCDGSACSTTPVPVSGLSGVTDIAGGWIHSLALLSNGTVMAWGNNEHGHLGNGTTSNSDVPVPVSGLSGVTAIAAGEYHSLALLSNGKVMAWGWNILWQLGSSAAEEDSLVPIPVSGLSGVTAIAAGNGQSYAVGAPPVPSPQVVSVAPDDGSPAGGTSVTITGINFIGATAVKFGSAGAASFTVDSETSITAVSPPGTGEVDLTVSTPEGTSYTSPRDLYSYEEGSRVEPEGGSSGSESENEGSKIEPQAGPLSSEDETPLGAGSGRPSAVGGGQPVTSPALSSSPTVDVPSSLHAQTMTGSKIKLAKALKPCKRDGSRKDERAKCDRQSRGKHATTASKTRRTRHA